MKDMGYFIDLFYRALGVATLAAAVVFGWMWWGAA